MLQYSENVQGSAPPMRVSAFPARIAIAGAQPLVLEGLAQVLRGFETSGVDRCGSGDELLATIVAVQPDLVVMDVELGDPDGLAVLREMRGRGLETAVIFMTGPLRDTEILEGIQLGIRGLLSKDAAIGAVEDCVRTVLEGGTCLDQSLVGKAMTGFLTRETAVRELSQLLTARELQVLQVVVAGTRPRDAASRLSVSEGTLKVHLHHIYQKLNVPSREHLIAYARERGLV
jgi:DNA-binding NarL/FixJ family response regulator